MKTILFHADHNILNSVMTRAAGGFAQCVAWDEERQVELSVFVCESKRLGSKSAPV